MKAVTEQEAINALALGVIEQAVKDLVLGDPILSSRISNVRAKLSAYQFLVSPYFQWWADIAGRDFDVNEILSNPERARQALLTRDTRR